MTSANIYAQIHWLHVCHSANNYTFILIFLIIWSFWNTKYASLKSCSNTLLVYTTFSHWIIKIPWVSLFYFLTYKLWIKKYNIIHKQYSSYNLDKYVQGIVSLKMTIHKNVSVILKKVFWLAKRNAMNTT